MFLTITDKDGVSCTLIYDETKAFSDAGSLDDSIFNYLDDDVAMSDFIRKNSTRKWLYSSC